MKKILFGAIALVISMAVMPNVLAEEGSYSDWSTLKTCLETTNSTCTLGGDVDADSSVTLADNVTLNLGTHTLKIKAPSKAIWVDNGNKATITGNGKIESVDYGVAVEGNTADNPTELTIGAGVEINAPKPLGVFNNEEGTDKNVSNIQIGGTLTSASSEALYINGDIQGGPNITVTGTINGNDAGIYQAGSSVITINNGKISGKSGIVTKAGTLNLKNATINATGEYAEGTVKNNTFDPTGAGIQIESNKPPYQGSVILNIEDSKITSANGDAIQEYGDGNEQVLKEINLKGDVTLTPAKGHHALFVNSNVGDDANEFKVTINGADTPITTLTEANGTFTTVVADSSSVKPENNPKNPNTSDSIYSWISIIAISIIGLTYTIKKKIFN